MPCKDRHQCSRLELIVRWAKMRLRWCFTFKMPLERDAAHEEASKSEDGEYGIRISHQVCRTEEVTRVFQPQFICTLFWLSLGYFIHLRPIQFKTKQLIHFSNAYDKPKRQVRPIQFETKEYKSRTPPFFGKGTSSAFNPAVGEASYLV